MHTVWVRLNAVVFFGLTVLLVLAVLTWLSTLVVGPDAAPVVEFVKLNSLRSLRSHRGGLQPPRTASHASLPAQTDDDDDAYGVRDLGLVTRRVRVGTRGARFARLTVLA